MHQNEQRYYNQASSSQNQGYYKPLYSEEWSQGNGQMQQPPQNQNYFDVTSKMAFSYGSDMANKEAQRLAEKLKSSGVVEKMRKYFVVDPRYVCRKLLILFFPFLHRNWSPEYDEEPQETSPINCVTAVDLYIPVMSFLSYLFISSCICGYKDRFTPQNLSILFTASLGMFSLEVLFLYLVFFFLGLTINMSVFTLMGILGYKYASSCILLIIHFLFGSPLSIPSLLYLSFAYVLFSFQTLRWSLLSEFSPGSERGPRLPNQSAPSSRLPVLICIAILEPLHIYLTTRI